MKKLLPLLLIALLALGLLPNPVSAVEPTRTIEVDDKVTKSFTWTSDAVVAAAPDFFLNGGCVVVACPVPVTEPYECNAFMDGNCEFSLIKITGLTQAEIDAGVAAGKALKDIKDSVSVTLGITNLVADMDIIIWASNESGEKINELGRVGDLDEDPSEEWSGSVPTTGLAPSNYVLLEVVFFAAVGSYDGYVNVS